MSLALIKPLCRQLLEQLGITSGGTYTPVGGAGAQVSADPILLDDGSGVQTYLSPGAADGSVLVGLSDGASDGAVTAGTLNASAVSSTGVPTLQVGGSGQGFRSSSSTVVSFVNGNDRVTFHSNGMSLGSSGALSCGANAQSTGNVVSADVWLERNGAGRWDVNASSGGGGNGTLGVTQIRSVTTDDLYLYSRGSLAMRLGSSRLSFGIQEVAMGSVGTPSYAMKAGAAAGTALTESIATQFSAVSLQATDAVWSALYNVSVYAADATDRQLRSDLVSVTLINDGGTITGTATVINSQLEESAGGSTLTTSYSVVDAGSNQASIRCDATSSLTQTTLIAIAHALSYPLSSSMGGASPSVAIN